MASTTFQNGVTLTDEDWFNDVDFLVYDLFGDSTTTASAAARIAGAFNNLTVAGTLSVSAAATLANVAVNGTFSVSAQAVVNALRVGGVLSATAIAGAVIATQAQMESALSTDAVVTPLRVHFHPGVAKAWVRFDGTATSVTAAASYNVTAITDNGSGNYTVAWSTAFSSGNYAVDVASSLFNSRLASVSSTNAQVILLDLSGTAADATIVSIIAFGDQ